MKEIANGEDIRIKDKTELFRLSDKFKEVFDNENVSKMIKDTKISLKKAAHNVLPFSYSKSTLPAAIPLIT